MSKASGACPLGECCSEHLSSDINKVPFFWLKTGLVLVELHGLGPQGSFICFFLNCTHTLHLVPYRILPKCFVSRVCNWKKRSLLNKAMVAQSLERRQVYAEVTTSLNNTILLEEKYFCPRLLLGPTATALLVVVHGVDHGSTP